ncbi:MAG: SRPBCC domain-containing protein [Rhodanobacteraceae bacterium]|mgnify:CR=1 FL=1|nr:SRPBCC domain-containing protein [Rhodanobacteraceae bacterium]HPF73891.1 SRPBCC family protein [Xanthomonadaceae bacterium]HRX98498.1 SRPBCC family protein [Xanthomonadaceae bacterium]
MPSIDSRSDIRSKLIPAAPEAVFAAMSDPTRLANWWGPDGFRNTIHEFDFRPDGRWLMTMHGPDGEDYPNESRFTRIVENRLFEIEHLAGHHFILTIELEPEGSGTRIKWQQAFDTEEHYGQIAEFVASANDQNLRRLAAEVAHSRELS